MEIDCAGSGLDQNGHASQFQKASSLHHLCNHTCVVAHEFGNVYRCCSVPGMLHICDSTCASRVYRDRYSSICLISRKVHGPLEAQQAQVHNQRKRECCSQDGADAAKRFNGAFAGSQEGFSMA